MVYIRGDGNVDERRSPWRFSIITDFLNGVWNFIALFFASVSQSTAQLHNGPSSTYAQRQGVRRPNDRSSSGGNRLGGGNATRRTNIRGVRNLGTACAPSGG